MESRGTRAEALGEEAFGGDGQTGGGQLCRTQCCGTSRPNSPRQADGELEHSREVLSIAWAVHMASPRRLQSEGVWVPVW